MEFFVGGGGVSLRRLWYKLRWGAMRHSLTNVRPEQGPQSKVKSGRADN